MHIDAESTTSTGPQVEEATFRFVGVAGNDLDFESLGDMEDDFEDPYKIDDIGSDVDMVMIVPRAKRL